MNWKLIFTLSLFGLAMGLATISLVPSKTEPLFWLVIFIICAIIIAKNAPGKYFLHGLMVSLVNSVWITASHIMFYSTYMANHPEMASMNNKMPLQEHPRLMMLIAGPVFGLISGLVLGLFAFLASRIFRRPNTAAGTGYQL